MTDERIDPRDQLLRRDVSPIVALPRSGVPTWLFMMLIVVGGMALFLALNARRVSINAARERPVRLSVPLAAAPPLVVPPAPPVPLPSPAAAPPQPRASAPAAAVQRPLPPTLAPAPGAGLGAQPLPPAPPERVRGDDPVLVVDATQGSSTARVATSSAGAPRDQAGPDEAVRVSMIRNRASLIPQGTLIAAVLETPLDSTRPGLARAVVSRDARSFDGSTILIPRGSRLIGEFSAETSDNARRILVSWTRLIRPDGAAIRIGSPAADALGGSGIAGRVNTHFFERFSNAVLQSALTIGTNIASQRVGGNNVYLGLPGQVATLGQQLLPNVNPRTTIKVKPGAVVSVFVARDLDFGGAPPIQ